jgi:hypothetical protein
MTETCPECGDEFDTERGRNSHYGQVHDGTIKGNEIPCDNCGESFRKQSGRIEKDSHHTCSDSCRAELVGELNSGSGHYDWKGCDYRVCRGCDEKFDYKKVGGRGVYCSTKCKGEDYRSRLKGENNPNYSTGDRKGFTPVERREILERDDYTCQDCEQVGGQLRAHHIEYVSEREDLAHDIDNGVTLCEECHAYRHEGESIFSAMITNLESE